MGERKSKDYNSVDLTEDEDSSEGNSENDSPFHFVDCSVTIHESSTPIDPISYSGSPPDTLDNGAAVMLAESSQGRLLRGILKSSSDSVETDSNKKVGQFSSIQIKPPINSNVPDSLQEFETVSLDSDNEEPTNNLSSPPPLLRNPQLLGRTTEITLPKKDTIYSLKQPPGKVVIIKKNNKFYKIIIPHNVMPNISKSMGPVLINIPEVGPLVISNDPQATQTKSNFINTQQLSLNFDDEQAKQECEAMKARKLKYEILKDKKFCWNFATTKKRDMEGFSATDRLGFNKAEMKKSSKCERTINYFLAKMRLGLINSINEYEKFNKSILKKDKIKLVKINSIIRASKKSGKVKTSTSLETDDYGSDLLLTKKVVILNNNKEVGHKTTVRKVGRPRRKDPKEISKIVKKHNLKRPANCQIRPCIVQLFKDTTVEKYCKERGLNAKKSPKPLSYITNSRKGLVLAKVSKQNNLEKLLCKTIYTEKQLGREVNPLKPTLVVTERTIAINRSIEYYCNEFSKNNIVFLVDSQNKFPSSLLEAKGFVSAVEVGYIKLVDANLFGRYSSSGMSFKKPVIDSRAEHNYSMIGK